MSGATAGTRLHCQFIRFVLVGLSRNIPRYWLYLGLTIIRPPGNVAMTVTYCLVVLVQTDMIAVATFLMFPLQRYWVIPTLPRRPLI